MKKKKKVLLHVTGLSWPSYSLQYKVKIVLKKMFFSREENTSVSLRITDTGEKKHADILPEKSDRFRSTTASGVYLP